MPRDALTLSLPQHWRDFLEAVDRRLGAPVTLHCIGGFVVEAVYGAPRRTGDLDYIAITPAEAYEDLERLAGRKSELAARYGLYFQRVGVADFPDEYEGRL